MKSRNLLVLLLLGNSLFAQQDIDFPKLTGSYLGQKPPGMVPELFAPEIVPTGLCETSICFSALGDEAFFVVSPLSRMLRVMLTSRIVNSFWTEFEEVPFFDSERSNSYPFLSLDGKKLYFNAWQPKNESTTQRTHEIWLTERSQGVWDKPQKIDFGGEFKSIGTFPSVSSNGNIYFSTKRDGDNSDIFCAKYNNGAYAIPVKLSPAINSLEGEHHQCIAPDESFLIFDSSRKDSSVGGQDLYISFKDKSGQWTKAVNLGPKINSQHAELRPWVSQDGKYLFFVSNRPIETALSSGVINKDKFKLLFNEPGNGDTNIFWVDASFIDELKPEELK